MAGEKTEGAQAHPDSAAPAAAAPAAAAPAPGADGTKPAAEGAKPAGDGGTPAPGAATAKPAAAGTTDGDGKPAGEQPPAAEGAPEKYALKVPDESKAFADDGAIAQLETIARKNNWTNEQAQVALENYIDDVKATSARYEAQTKADPDYGGDKLEATKQYARAAILAIRPEGHPRRESFLRFLNSGGAGNHIEAISFLADLGRMIGEDGAVGGKSGGASEKSAADRLYDHPTSKS
jgi:hypothetical protein